MTLPPPLRGALRPPGDRSVGVRALLLAARARGASTISHVPDTRPFRTTVRVLRDLGVRIQGRLPGDLVVHGGFASRSGAPRRVDCGGSATLARLLMGLLAPLDLTVLVDGDPALRRRPMDRVVGPLVAAGADLRHVDGPGTLPVLVTGRPCRRRWLRVSLPSGQVKSSLLFALLGRPHGLLLGRLDSRDHLERLLPLFGAVVRRRGPDAEGRCYLHLPGSLTGTRVPLPADPSSAAFLAVAAMLRPGSAVTLSDVIASPGRTGFIPVLQAMGAVISLVRHRRCGGEDVADLVAEASPSPLHPVTVPAASVPACIDEIPVLAACAARIPGTSTFEGLAELRIKESDRLEGLRRGLVALGADAQVSGDTLVVEGGLRPILAESSIETRGDHRLAMALAVPRFAAGVPVVFDDEGRCLQDSYPDFLGDLARLGPSLAPEDVEGGTG